MTTWLLKVTVKVAVEPQVFWYCTLRPSTAISLMVPQVRPVVRPLLATAMPTAAATVVLAGGAGWARPQLRAPSCKMAPLGSTSPATTWAKAASATAGALVARKRTAWVNLATGFAGNAQVVDQARLHDRLSRLRLIAARQNVVVAEDEIPSIARHERTERPRTAETTGLVVGIASRGTEFDGRAFLRLIDRRASGRNGDSGARGLGGIGLGSRCDTELGWVGNGRGRRIQPGGRDGSKGRIRVTRRQSVYAPLHARIAGSHHGGGKLLIDRTLCAIQIQRSRDGQHRNSNGHGDAGRSRLCAIRLGDGGDGHVRRGRRSRGRGIESSRVDQAERLASSGHAIDQPGYRGIRAPLNRRHQRELCADDHAGPERHDRHRD